MIEGLDWIKVKVGKFNKKQEIVLEPSVNSPAEYVRGRLEKIGWTNWECGSKTGIGTPFSHNK